MLYNTDFEISALFFAVILAGYFFKKEYFFDQKSRLFAFLVVDILVVLSLHIISAYTISYASSVAIWINYLVNIIYMSANNLLAPLFFCYAIMLNEDAKPLSIKMRGIIFLPTVIFQLIILFTPFTHFVFYFDSNLRYITNWAHLALYIVSAIYIVMSVLVTFFNKKKINSIQFYTIISFMSLILIGMVLQLTFREYLISGFVVTLALYMMYLTIQGPTSYYDDMSGLFKKRALLSKLNKMLLTKQSACLLTLDINDFKDINSLLGVKGGDELIKQVSLFMKSLVHDRCAFRYNDDKFIIIVPNGDKYIVNETIERCLRPWLVGGNWISITLTQCYIPIFEYSRNMVEAESFIDSIFIYSKTQAKGSFLEINDETYQRIQRRYQVEKSVKNATQLDKFEIYFQPIYNRAKHIYDKAEVLLRLNDEELGYIPPDEFIIVAEQIGLIDKIGKIVIAKTCEAINKSNLMSYGLENVNINLSTLQCLNHKLGLEIIEIIGNYNLPYKIFNFEMTETAAINSKMPLLNLMQTLAESGITFSMDDYGSGYSNSDTIISLPFNTIKLDKNMLWNASNSEKAKIIYESIVKMIQRLNLQIVAEGAETTKHINLLSEMNVDYIQGFYYSRPLPIKEYVLFMSTNLKDLPIV